MSESGIAGPKTLNAFRELEERVRLNPHGSDSKNSLDVGEKKAPILSIGFHCV